MEGLHKAIALRAYRVMLIEKIIPFAQDASVGRRQTLPGSILLAHISLAGWSMIEGQEKRFSRVPNHC